MTEAPAFCPDHGDPHDQWPCPVACEGDPPEGPTCPHLMDELERRRADIEAGNFWRMQPRGATGEMVFEEYKAHEPTGVIKTFPRGEDA